MLVLSLRGFGVKSLLQRHEESKSGLVASSGDTGPGLHLYRDVLGTEDPHPVLLCIPLHPV